MTAFADLILPDTTYLERHDVMSLLDRPISEFEGPVDSVRIPVLPPTGECKPFQEVLIELAGRLKLPAFTNADGTAKFRDYPDFIVRYETAPGSGIGFLAGWRGKDGENSLRGEPNPKQWEMYARNNCVFQYRSATVAAVHAQLEPRLCGVGAADGSAARLRRRSSSTSIRSSSSVSGWRHRASERASNRRSACASESTRYFDPLPFWYAPLESAATDTAAYPLNAVTQRPMAMYHSWDSQNAWLRQIHAHNYLMVNPRTAQRARIGDGAWMWVESPWGKVRCMCRYSEAVEPGTVWTWNAIGKAAGAWTPVPRRQRIAAGLPPQSSDCGGAARHRRHGAHLQFRPGNRPSGWYDVRVRIYPAAADEPEQTSPQFPALVRVPGVAPRRRGWLAYFAGGSERMTQLALVIDLNVCVGCHACVTSCKQWNTSGAAGPLADLNAYGTDPTGTFFNRVQTFEVGEFPNTQTVTFRNAACTARIRRASPSVRPARATSAPRTASCWSTTTSASAASTARGRAPTACASSTRGRR